MKTQCTRPSVRFQSLSGRELIATFDGGAITSDGGLPLLEQVDRRIGLLARVADCFTDRRAPGRIQHSVRDLVTQRVFALCAGHEDLSDHDSLRSDPLLRQLVGRRDSKELASSSTLNRLELSAEEVPEKERYKKITLDTDALDELFVELMIEDHKTEPAEIILDLDATDVLLHGEQEERFYHGYYKNYCYLPLYIFCGEHLLTARLRPSNIDGAKGALDEVKRIVAIIRRTWKSTRIIIRADSGFCRDDLLDWCETNERIEYVIGLARNKRLEAELAPFQAHAKDIYKLTKERAKLFTSFTYRTKKSWSRARRVIGKAEQIPGKANPRFIVTSLACEDSRDATRLYTEVYCARGDMENRIKEQQNYMFADRLSAHEMRANQVRVYLSGIAYILLHGVRRLALQGTDMAKAQCHTIREKLLRIGARVKVTARRIWVHMSEACPMKDAYLRAMARLSILPEWSPPG